MAGTYNIKILFLSTYRLISSANFEGRVFLGIYVCSMAVTIEQGQREMTFVNSFVRDVESNVSR